MNYSRRLRRGSPGENGRFQPYKMFPIGVPAAPQQWPPRPLKSAHVLRKDGQECRKPVGRVRRKYEQNINTKPVKGRGNVHLTFGRLKDNYNYKQLNEVQTLKKCERSYNTRKNQKKFGCGRFISPPGKTALGVATAGQRSAEPARF